MFARTLFIGGIFLLCPYSYALEIGDPAPDFLREQHASCHNYFVDGQTVPLFKKLGAEEDVFPFIMLMKPGGEISYRRAGSLDAMELKLAILRVLGRSFNR